MKVLVVASGNASFISPFILDQADALIKEGVDICYFLVKGKGLLGYLKNYKKLLGEVKRFKPEIIHAHYGLSGLLCAMQRKIPVVTTFHGSDINMKKVRIFSKIADILSSKSIFVSYDLAKKLNKKEPIVIPCGIDLDVFYPINKKTARKKTGLSLQKKYLLFSSSFANLVKNYPLAKEAIIRSGIEIELIELKGYNREEVALLMNAVDAVIMTSFTEGSPQFIKEAMACNTPIISTDVGDVAEIIKDTDGCYLTNNRPEDVASNIQKALKFNNKTNGRNNISRFDNSTIADKIVKLYNSILKE